MNIHFNLKQLNVLSKLDIYIDPNKDYTDEEMLEIDDAVVKYLQHKGIDDGELNEIGELCQSILDILAS